MEIDLKKIAPFVEKQFPDFYQEEGANFIQFVKAYYEWLDTDGPISKSRALAETTDIDTTAEEYLQHFFEKYLHGIPKSILGNKRLLEKHILSLYRSKGSIEGLKLLFRFLYRQEINVYVPEVDMLRVSDGKWVRPQYLEISDAPLNYTFDGKFIKGTDSQCIAFVDNVVKFYLGNQICHVLYITNVTPGPTGESFLPQEHLLYDGLDLRDSPYILSSPVGAIVNDSSPDFAIGDYLVTDSPSGERLLYQVSTLKDSTILRGYIKFEIKYGGFGYAIDSPVTIGPGTATTGTGANFKIGAITNTQPFTYNTNLLGPILNIKLNSLNYGATLNFAFIGTKLNNALTNSTLTVGTISKLTGVTSGDHNYNGSVTPSVIDYRIYGYGIQDPYGNFWGGDANITGNPSTGNGVIDSVILVNSGLGYNEDGEVLEFYNRDNQDLQCELVIQTDGIGKGEGYWKNSDGFLNADKYIQDSYYYQEYSYEIQIEKSFEKYVDILKKVMHPVGNRVFGKVLITDINSQSESLNTIDEIFVQDTIQNDFLD